MKIAVFGDSYADLTDRKYQHLPYLHKAWPALLKEKYKVFNYAQAGSGPDFSALKLRQLEASGQMDQIDKIIFIVSDPRRMYVHPDYHKRARYPHYQASYTSQYEDAEIRKTVLAYFKFFMIDELIEYKHELLVKDIKQKYKDKVLLLKNYWQYNQNLQKYYSNNLPLCDLGVTEDELTYPHLKENQEYQDFKICHLTTKHHKVLLKKIIDWIKTDKFSLTKYDILPLQMGQNLLEYQQYVKEKKK